MFELLDFPSLWRQLADLFAPSPFWEYLFWGILACLGALLLGWLFPVLRSLTSAVVLAVIGMLFAYRRGESDAERREREKRARERRTAPKEPWTWWRRDD